MLDATESAIALIRDEMEHVIPLRIPLQVDIGAGPNWDATD